MKVTEKPLFLYFTLYIEYQRIIEDVFCAGGYINDYFGKYVFVHCLVHEASFNGKSLFWKKRHGKFEENIKP